MYSVYFAYSNLVWILKSVFSYCFNYCRVPDELRSTSPAPSHTAGWAARRHVAVWMRIQNAGCVPLFHRWVESTWQLRHSKRLFGLSSSCRFPTSKCILNVGKLLFVFSPQLVLTTPFNGRYGGGPPRFGGNRGGGGGKFGNPGDRLRKKQWNLDELPKFEKNFYQQHPDVARRSMVWWRQCCVTVLKMCFPSRHCTCWELRNRPQPLVFNLFTCFNSRSKRSNNTEGPKPLQSKAESVQTPSPSFMKRPSLVSMK